MNNVMNKSFILVFVALVLIPYWGNGQCNLFQVSFCSYNQNPGIPYTVVLKPDNAPTGAVNFSSISFSLLNMANAPVAQISTFTLLGNFPGFTPIPPNLTVCDRPYLIGVPIVNVAPGPYKLVMFTAFGPPTSAVCSDTVNIQVLPSTLQAPVVSLGTGTYSGNQTVTISSPDNLPIYYTTNGNTPVIGPSFTKLYTGPIVLSSSLNLKAAAISQGISSQVTSVFYTINDPQVVANPTFSLTPGVYTGIQSLSLSTVTSGSTIYFTTNGNVPRFDVPNSFTRLYTGPITLDRSMTIRAIALRPGYVNSGVTVGNFTINGVGTVANPTFSPAPGTFGTPQSVSISSTTPGARILYTTNGNTPVDGHVSSRLYSTPVNIAQTTQLKARAFLDGSISSGVSVGNYTIGALRQSTDDEPELSFYFESGAEDALALPGNIRIFPNPSASGIFNLDAGTEKVLDVQVFTATGQKIEAAVSPLAERQIEIQLGNVNPGLYLLRLTTASGSKLYRLVK